jgi:branched-chain amino acid transport system ATP-binding protein
MTLLAVSGLNKRFGGVVAARDVAFSLQAGELLAIIGPNGAGKSTTFNMVGGQLRPDSGQVMLAGENVAGLAPRAIWRRGVGRTFQIAQTFVSMSVAENVQMALISWHGRIFSFRSRAETLYRPEALDLLDLVGMDTQQLLCEAMHGLTHEPRAACPPLVRRMIAAGRLGKKTGRGFHDYADSKMFGA